MSTTEFPATGSDPGINSQAEVSRAAPVVLRDNRFLCWVTMSGGLFAAFMGVCMLLMVLSLVSSSAFDGAKGLSALEWAASALAMGYLCIRLWTLGRAMSGYQVVMDSKGVNFNLGTKKKSSDLFMAWDQVAAINFKRVGNMQQCLVQGTDGSEARFSSYTFFRPKKVARMIAERAGLVIQKG
jgi:hypothetical protein